MKKYVLLLNVSGLDESEVEPYMTRMGNTIQENNFIPRKFTQEGRFIVIPVFNTDTRIDVIEFDEE